MLLKQAERIVSVVSWHNGKLARVARSSNAAELQAVADAQGRTHLHASLTARSLRRAAPLKNCQKFVGQVPATVVLDNRGVYGTLACSDSSCRGLKDNRSGFEALVLKRPLVWTRCGSRWAHSAAQLADCITRESEKAPRPFEFLKRARKVMMF